MSKAIKRVRVAASGTVTPPPAPGTAEASLREWIRTLTLGDGRSTRKAVLDDLDAALKATRAAGYDAGYDAGYAAGHEQQMQMRIRDAQERGGAR